MRNITHNNFIISNLSRIRKYKLAKRRINTNHNLARFFGTQPYDKLIIYWILHD